MKKIISKDLILELRRITGQGVMNCKIALEETDGDMKKAIDYIQKKRFIEILINIKKFKSKPQCPNGCDIGKEKFLNEIKGLAIGEKLEISPKCPVCNDYIHMVVTVEPRFKLYDITEDE